MQRENCRSRTLATRGPINLRWSFVLKPTVSLRHWPSGCILWASALLHSSQRPPSAQWAATLSGTAASIWSTSVHLRLLACPNRRVIFARIPSTSFWPLEAQQDGTILDLHMSLLLALEVIDKVFSDDCRRPRPVPFRTPWSDIDDGFYHPVAACTQSNRHTNL